MKTVYGNVFNIQRFSIEDGPGIRSTVFLKGCPLRCLWCSNPESQLSSPQVGYRQSVCIHCGRCFKACDQGAICLENGEPPRVKIDRRMCSVCGKCVDACPAGALKTYGKRMTVEEVYEEIGRDAGYYSKSGGGVTVSGGEAMAQAEFTIALLKKCKAAGIHTVLDTCGFYDNKLVNEVCDYVDLVLYDIKHMDNEEHIRCTGVSNKLILENARLFVQRGVDMWIRVPLIPGFNDSPKNLEDTALFVRNLRPGLSVTLLPYHNFGQNKYKMLDMTYPLDGLEKSNKQHLDECKAVFDRLGVKCSINL